MQENLLSAGTNANRSGGSSSGGRKAKKSSRSEQRAALQAAKRKGREKVAKQDGEITVKMAGMRMSEASRSSIKGGLHLSGKFAAELCEVVTSFKMEITDLTGIFWNVYYFPSREGILDQTPAELPKGTGLVYDESIKRHRCPIGSKHGESECPERLTVCMERLEARGLVERCIQVPTRPITDEEILSLHSEEYLQTLKTISSLPADELQTLAESYDSVFLCNESFEVVRLVAGGLLNLTEKVVKGELRNGCAVVRLSGHHAQRDRANGYSILNSVSLAAKQARTKWGVDRVLIVDWDVHHGQGTQYFFEDDPSVVYFSMHRYENMDFWPHLEESNYDHIGLGAGKGYNVNVPWNKTGMGDAEFLAVFHNLLLPLAHEFNPQLILVSAGFDSAINDPKGEMAVSPACFAHLTRELMSLAEGRVVLGQEGGYCLDSLGESMAWCVEALLGDECPALPPLKGVCDSASETMLNVIKALQPYWNCFQCQVKPLESKKPIQNEAVSSTTPDDQPSQGGEGNGAADPTAEVRAVGDRLQKELALSRPPHRTGLVYDEQMKLHKAFNHPERPERISRIYAKHQEHGLVARCHRLKSRKVTDEELRTCHL
ncbi:histone deacetylase 6-like [Diadema antillarum]|uniref:histone deacetylase 6-like n=1 Tax=Diadema antillarum TaxID=105358 RepID=UPI003A847C98